MAGFLSAIVGAQAAYTYVSPKGEWKTSRSQGLQGIIDGCGNAPGSGYVCINSDADQLDDTCDGDWRGDGRYSVAIIAEMAGNARKNSFGIYNAEDPIQKLQLLRGKSNPGAQVMFDSPYTTFGFYLKTAKGYWYSDSGLNNGKGPANQDHMVAYAGKGTDLRLGKDTSGTDGCMEWDSDCYLLGWEDLNLRKSDRDYNDLVLLFSRLDTPAPVPDQTNTIASLFLTCGVIAFLGRSRLAARFATFGPKPRK